MRVVVHLTIDGTKETVLEGNAHVFDGDVTGDMLEHRKIGFWMNSWRYHQPEGKGTRHKGRVFCPWTSVLFVEESSERG